MKCENVAQLGVTLQVILVNQQCSTHVFYAELIWSSGQNNELHVAYINTLGISPTQNTHTYPQTKNMDPYH